MFLLRNKEKSIESIESEKNEVNDSGENTIIGILYRANKRKIALMMKPPIMPLLWAGLPTETLLVTKFIGVLNLSFTDCLA